MKHCLILTKIAYPFGGGEKYLYDTFFWMRSWGLDVCWIAFTDSTHQPFETTLWDTPCIKVRGGFTIENIQNWIRFLQPDFIHTQGIGLPFILDAMKPFRIPILMGFHFWTHLIQLGPKHNQLILENIDSHTLDPFYIEIKTNPLITQYVCSPFLNRVLKAIEPTHCDWIVIPPTPECPTFVKTCTASYITHINIHPLKGGDWLPSIVARCPQWNFQFIHTEPGSESIIQHLNFPNVKLLPFTSNIDNVYVETYILLILSLVDETYGRVAYEGLFYNIPIITTGRGNLRELLGDCAIYVSNPQETIDAINQLSNKRKYIEMKDKCRQRLTEMNHGKSILYEQIMEKPLSRVMFLAPFTDQGLGIQTRRYKELFEENQHPVFIFSYRSYYSQQVDSAEWDMRNVYVSQNIRETIQPSEIKEAIEKFAISHVIIPETCFPPIFKLAEYIRNMGCKVIAIPNIEIIREPEIILHQVFHEIWTNNYFSYQKLQPYQHFLRIRNIGFPIRPYPSQPASSHKQLTFCCIGGMNAFSRKQIHKVIEAFKNLDITNYQCIITNQGDRSNEIDRTSLPSSIIYMQQAMSHKDIDAIYERSDIVIQVSKHEGLGLGFYEALEHRKPVLTLDVPLYREIVQQAGWFIPAELSINNENKQAIVESYDFYISDMENMLRHLLTNPINWESINERIEQRIHELNFHTFYQRLRLTI